MILISCILFAQEVSEAKLDTLIQNQDQMLENQEEIIANTKFVDNLAGKSFGVEINPFRLLNPEKTDYTGGFSLFNVNPNAEIAFPVVYNKTEVNYESETGESSYDFTEFSIDGIYRFFLGQRRHGYYISTGARYSYLNGMTHDGSVLGLLYNTKGIESENRFGVSFGVGYRIYGRKGFYWGASLYLGRYLTKSQHNFVGKDIFQSGKNKTFYAFELLKFGKAF